VAGNAEDAGERQCRAGTWYQVVIGELVVDACAGCIVIDCDDRIHKGKQTHCSCMYLQICLLPQELNFH